jgi:DNA-binding transcriptional regulator YiaG
MINVRELNACLAREGLSRADGAKLVGVTPKTFYEWLNKAVMPTDKAEILIQKLKIENPANIFFNGVLLDR